MTVQSLNKESTVSKGLVWAGTGHRPIKLGGYGPLVEQRLHAIAVATITHYEPTAMISGMALGWDTALADAALSLSTPRIAAVPFAGQEKQWPQSSQDRYRRILELAETVQIVSIVSYSSRAMELRNRWMVDRCQILLALWDGTSWGTGNCVAYARGKRPVVNL